MFIDSRSIPNNKIIHADICIVGAGPAGVSLACEFINQPIHVCLLESGGVTSNKKTQNLSKGLIKGLPYRPLDSVRLRCFGGTTNWWHAMCQQLDDTDFEQRPWIPYSGWPFKKSHLAPFYLRAEKFFKLSLTNSSLASDLHPQGPKSFPDNNSVITRLLRLCPTPQIKNTHRTIIEQASNIDCYLNANVTNVLVNEKGNRVAKIHVENLDGPKFSVSAKIYVLAAGGIENARILLTSGGPNKNGLGNENDMVGRFFMTHPYLDSGILFPLGQTLSVCLYKYQKVDQVKSMVTLGLSRQVQCKEHLLNFNARFCPSFPEVESSSVSSILYLLKELYMLRGKSLPQNFREHVLNTFKDPSNVMAFGLKNFLKPVFLRKNIEACYLENSIETAPNPSSRLVLLEEKDPLGMKRIGLDWQLGPLDKSSLIRSQEILRDEVKRVGLGRLLIQISNEKKEWPFTVRGTAHHIGTTRMDTNPKQGVVDENCKVHNLKNLYIAGSSTFPTCGSVPPTLTIVALSIRLADCIKQILRENFK